MELFRQNVCVPCEPWVISSLSVSNIRYEEKVCNIQELEEEGPCIPSSWKIFGLGFFAAVLSVAKRYLHTPSRRGFGSLFI